MSGGRTGAGDCGWEGSQAAALPQKVGEMGVQEPPNHPGTWVGSAHGLMMAQAVGRPNRKRLQVPDPSSPCPRP